jgi:hypothetical protein
MHYMPADGGRPMAGSLATVVPEAVARQHVVWPTNRLNEGGRDHSGRPRIGLRPYENPLPLGFSSFTTGMVLFAGIGLGWLTSTADLRTEGILMAVW